MQFLFFPQCVLLDGSKLLFDLVSLLRQFTNLRFSLVLALFLNLLLSDVIHDLVAFALSHLDKELQLLIQQFQFLEHAFLLPDYQVEIRIVFEIRLLQQLIFIVYFVDLAHGIVHGLLVEQHSVLRHSKLRLVPINLLIPLLNEHLYRIFVFGLRVQLYLLCLTYLYLLLFLLFQFLFLLFQLKQLLWTFINDLLRLCCKWRSTL